MPWSRPGAPPTETFMTSRRDSLSYMLLMPALAYASPALADSQPGNPPTTGPIYRTQPGTTELPPRYPPPAGPDARLRLAYWNEVALSTLARDTTPPFPGQALAVAEQGGPTRATRSMAIERVARVGPPCSATASACPGKGGVVSRASVDKATSFQ